MESALQVFTYKEHQVRTVTISDEIWFVAKDVCEVLEMTVEATRRLDEDEKGLRKIQTPSGMQDMTVINEPGLYTLLMRSNKPEAKPFRRWVTHDVLPTIRKTGSYAIPGAEHELEPLNIRVRIAGILQRLALQVSDNAIREHINRESYKYATGEDLPEKKPEDKPKHTPRYWTAQQVAEALKWPTDAVMHRAEKLGIMKKPANGMWDGDTWKFTKEGRNKFMELVRAGIVKIEDGYEYYENGDRHIYWSFNANAARP